MQSRRTFMLSLAIVGTASGLRAPLRAQTTRAGAVAATAITQVFGNGIRLVAVALEYPKALDGSRLNSADFSVEGRTVTGVYTASSAESSSRAETGRFVIVTLSPEDPGARLAIQPQGRGQGSGPPRPSDGPPPGMGSAGSVPANVSEPKFRAPKARITPMAELKFADGSAVPGTNQAIDTNAAINPIVDAFRQLEFKDRSTGDTLRYNLFVPTDYDPSKTYPLILFMHDAGVTSDQTRATLMQGLGALCWASPQDQAKRPCLVLAPQFAQIIADDDSHTSSMLDTTIHLIEALSRQYNIDPARRYATGQSGGCMMSIAMNIKYPDFFAASFLVAGQWNPALVSPMAHDRLWIVVSQDDHKAFPGQNSITEALENNGARVHRAIWDGTWSPDQFRFAFDEVDAAGSPINYICFAAGTVIPPGESTQGAAGHMNTWRIAYAIEPIREWIFRQHR